MPRIPYSRFKRYPRPLQGGARVVAGPGGPGTISGSYQAALNRANAANEKRYQQILSEYDALRARVMGGLEGLGAADRQAIDREYNNAASNVYSSLIGRGFGNSSLAHTMQQGVSRGRMEAQGRLNERLAAQRAAYDADLTQGKLGVMERRYDNAPDINQMLALYQGLGRAGYAGGYGMRIGQPIGIAPGAYQNAYMMGLMNHLGNIRSGPMYQGGVPMANIRAQQNRLRRYGGGSRPFVPPFAPALPMMPPQLSGSPISLGAINQMGPFRAGYQFPLTPPVRSVAGSFNPQIADAIMRLPKGNPYSPVKKRG